MELTATNVHDVLMDCLFTAEEDKTNYIQVLAVSRFLGLNPDRVQKHKEDIEDMLSQLPIPFSVTGASFLNACINKDGDQWGEHENVDELICLGLAIGKIKISPRAAWGSTMGVPIVAVI